MKVRGISEEEMFKAVGTGKKTKKKSWKRMITKPTFGTYEIVPVTMSDGKHDPNGY